MKVLINRKLATIPAGSRKWSDLMWALWADGRLQEAMVRRIKIIFPSGKELDFK